MRKSIVAATAVLALASLVWAAGRPGLVKTKDGGVYDGSVDEKEESVTVNVRGIETSIARDNILSISYGDFETRWTDAYQKLDKTDQDGRIAAARRAFDERRYDLAEKALRDTVAMNPNNAEAADLLKLTINQRRLEHNTATPPADRGGDTAAPAVPVKPAGLWNTLSPAEINSIKQNEVHGDDMKARYAFENGVRKKYYDNNPQLATTYRTYSDFMKQPQGMQAAMIIKDGGDLAKDVKVVNDPELILSFRKSALPLVLQGCATSTCHGGSDASAVAKFALISPAPDNAAVYTDFYVLTTTKVNMNVGMVANVTSGGPAWAYMVDRTHPDASLVLQYGLADAMADNKHPKVPGYTGIYPRGKSDPKYTAVLNFIQALNPVAPDYGISFTLARSGSAAPATSPSTQPVKAAIDAIKGAVGNK